MRRYLIIVLGLVIFLSVIVLGRILQLRYISTDASSQVIQITSRMTDSYVDATQPIIDGIAQLADSGGGVLFFGPGKYLVQQTIDIPSNITIEGVGAGAVGPTMIVLGNDGDMDATGMALFSIQAGAENVSIKDVELRSMTPGPNVYPRYDVERIGDENTTAIRIYGSGSSQTRNIELQNLRLTNFTFGVDTGSSDGSNPVIDNVKIKSVVSDVNHWAIRVRSLNARNWDVQNFNIVEMSSGQSGVLLERTGKMSFLQLSCASTLHNADLCLDIRQRSGALHFTQAHVEGPADGVRVRTASIQPIYFDNSAISGTVEANSVIYSIANRLSLDNSNHRFNFINGGTQSTLYRCGDVFTNGYPNPEENTPTDPYPGLITVPVGCNFDLTQLPNPYSSDFMDFQSFDWVASGSSPSSTQLNVRNFGAVGDGVTDDTAAFQAAMQDVDFWSASTIIVPSGTYKISDTLQLEDGITFQGENGSVIMFTPADKPLFLVRVLQSDAVTKRGIGLKNLSLVSSSAGNAGQSSIAIEFSGNRGASGDFIFSDLDITGFAKGVYGHNDTGSFDQHQPQLDSYLFRNITFSNTGIAIEQRDQNISNWNLVDISIQDMRAGQKGVKIDGGSGLFRNLSCEGVSSQNLAEVCVQLGRFSGAKFDGVTSSNTKHAFYVEWSMGWTPFPLLIINSDLRDGLYVAGKMYLTSANNIYSDGGETSPLGSRSTFFNVFNSDDPLNVYPGNGSRITTCGDEFTNSLDETSEVPVFVGLSINPVRCLFGSVDTTSPVVSVTNPVAGTTVSGSSVTLSADATDDVAVVGVQFKINGSNLGTEDVSSPYSFIWDSTLVANGSHTITTVARDAAGNSATSTAVVVNVNNTVSQTTVAMPIISPSGGTFSSTQSISLTTSTPGATIYYTTNGSTPTAASMQYASPFSVSSTTTVKAIAIKTGMINSNISTVTFTRSSTSTGGSSGGGGTTSPPTPTNPPSVVSGVILPPNVIAGQVIKFSNAPTIYLVQSTGLHPFDTWSSFTMYQSQSGAQIIVRDGTASSFTVSSILARTVLSQATPQTTPPSALPSEGTDFVCSGNPTIYYHYKGTKLGYSEAGVYEAWNGKNYSSVRTFATATCDGIPSNGFVPLPEGAIVRVPGGSEIYMISGRSARPFTSFAAYQRESAGKTTNTISLRYLHTYSRGENIN